MKKTILAFSAIIFVGVIAIFFIVKEEESKRKIPILNPNDVNPLLVDSSIQSKGIGHLITGFNLINQDGEKVNESVIKDKIVVADFFFTSCPSICPKMTSQLQRVQEEFKNEDRVMILSHTVWPERDSVPLLKNYAEQYNADKSKWLFLTGNKVHLYDLARKSYLVAPSLTDTNFTHGSENDFVHTENFVLVDAKKRIRGYFDGTDKEEVDNLILDIKELLKRM